MLSVSALSCFNREDDASLSVQDETSQLRHAPLTEQLRSYTLPAQLVATRNRCPTHQYIYYSITTVTQQYTN